MNSNFTLLITGFLFVGVIALLSLFWAIRHTAEGCEDEKGFHLDGAGKRVK